MLTTFRMEVKVTGSLNHYFIPSFSSEMASSLVTEMVHQLGK